MYIIGDYREVPRPSDITLMVADPVYDAPMVNEIIDLAFEIGCPAVVFSSVEDLYRLKRKPDQTAFWLKQPSTKNTVKNYSVFVEPITFWNGAKFYGKLHWSTRTGVFHDSIIDNGIHPWKKPDSLIEKLVRNHYPGHGTVYDPCAGSGTVEDVCKRLNIPSLSVEIKDGYR